MRGLGTVLWTILLGAVATSAQANERSVSCFFAINEWGWDVCGEVYAYQDVDNPEFSTSGDMDLELIRVWPGPCDQDLATHAGAIVKGIQPLLEKTTVCGYVDYDHGKKSGIIDLVKRALRRAAADGWYTEPWSYFNRSHFGNTCQRFYGCGS